MDGEEDGRAEIQQIGRWTYRVRVVDGLLSWGPDGYGWRVWGRNRAERKARKVLAAYRRMLQREQQTWTVS